MKSGWLQALVRNLFFAGLFPTDDSSKLQTLGGSCVGAFGFEGESEGRFWWHFGPSKDVSFLKCMWIIVNLRRWIRWSQLARFHGYLYCSWRVFSPFNRRYIYIYIFTCNPKWSLFDWKRPSFRGLTFKKWRSFGLQPICPLFWGLDLQKQSLLSSKKGSSSSMCSLEPTAILRIMETCFLKTLIVD